jgi:hypothetical protein
VTTVGDDVPDILNCMYVEAAFKLGEGGRKNTEASKNIMGGAENHACRP